MATHNHLTALSPDTFLEVIAIDSQAGPAARSRWFQLGDPDYLRLLDNGPRLTTWVARTNDLERALQAAAEAGIDAGEPVELSRGNLTWRLALKPDGSLACQGLFPILIQWPAGVNPVDQMLDQGVRLDQLMLLHPETAFIENALKAVGAGDLAAVLSGDAGIKADMHTATERFQLSN